jgi:GTPase SAR1 family protein
MEAEMRDFIFIIGASGVGKSTLSRRLFEHYKGAYVEMNMVPEFGLPDDVDPGMYEEMICWECCVAQLKKFNELGIKNVISGDFDDLRTADIPIVFKGYNYITLKLICSDFQQNYIQMKNRENGLVDFELLERSSMKINYRCLLVNEACIDVAGKPVEKILYEAIDLIENAKTLLDYSYIKPAKENFYSWIHSNGLR